MCAVGCGASTPSGAATEASRGGVFRDGDVVGYLVRDPAGQIVGRLHCRFAEQEGLRTVIARAVYGAAAADVRRFRPQRTTERATSFGPEWSVRRLKVLSSVEGLDVFRYENGSVLRTGAARTDRHEDPNPDAVPLHPDDPAVLALFFETLGLRPGDGRRVFVRAEDAINTEPWLVQMFADNRRNTVVRLPWGRARLDAHGRIARLEMKTGIVYERLPEAGPAPDLIPMPKPLAYRRPAGARWRDRETRIEVQGGILAGVLSAPEDPGSSGAPGIVFFSDLGPQDRHGFGRGVDAGTWAILDHLAAAGFAVLRFDDRGVRASRSSFRRRDIGARLAADDARRVMAFMRRQPEVHPDRLLIVGHGFGAYDALAVAEDPAVRGLVLIAPPARGPVPVLADRWARVHRGQVATRRQELAEVLRAALGDSAGPLKAPIAMMQAYAEDARWLADRRPLLQRRFPLLPTLVVQGMKDFEVSWRADAQALVRHINGPRGKHARLQVYEDVDHLLKAEPRVSRPDRYRIKTRPVAPRALRDLTGWINTQLSIPGAGSPSAP